MLEFKSEGLAFQGETTERESIRNEKLMLQTLQQKKCIYSINFKNCKKSYGLETDLGFVLLCP